MRPLRTCGSSFIPTAAWRGCAFGARRARRGAIERVDLDTTHFRGKSPESASLEACDVVGRSAPPDDAPWRELVARTTLRANARHRLAVPPGRRDPLTHVRLNIFPDGG